MASDFETTVGYLNRAVRKMLEEQSAIQVIRPSADPSEFWQGAKLYRYLLDLSPEYLRNIRFHTSAISGEIPAFGIVEHLETEELSEQEAHAIGYAQAIEGVPEEFWIGEPEEARFHGPLGRSYRGRVVNPGTIIRYQNCVSNLFHVGAFQLLRSAEERQLVVEIGGGHGGLAHSLGSILGEKCVYCIIDLPELLFISGTFLALTNPGKSIYVYDSESFTPEFLREGIKQYDFVLIPNFALSKLKDIGDIALFINMQSFSEMTVPQVSEYLEFGASHLSGYLYSDNSEKHEANNEMESVSALLSNHYELFPSPAFYDDLYRYKVWGETGSYRKYFGIPRGSGRTIPTTRIVGLPPKRQRPIIRRVVRAAIPPRFRQILARFI